MHSSRMHTGRSLTVSGGGLPACQGGSACQGGGIPACTEAEPPLWTESHTPVKTLPWPNFVAAGNYTTAEDPVSERQNVILAEFCVQFWAWPPSLIEFHLIDS